MVRLHAVKGFLAQDMLHAAGICQGRFLAYPNIHQQMGNHTMLFIGALCQCLALFCQHDTTLILYLHIALCLQLFHGIGNAGLAEAHFQRNIHRAHKACFLI